MVGFWRRLLVGIGLRSSLWFKELVWRHHKSLSWWARNIQKWQRKFGWLEIFQRPIREVNVRRNTPGVYKCLQLLVSWPGYSIAQTTMCDRILSVIAFQRYTQRDQSSNRPNEVPLNSPKFWKQWFSLIRYTQAARKLWMGAGHAKHVCIVGQMLSRNGSFQTNVAAILATKKRNFNWKH